MPREPPVTSAIRPFSENRSLNMRASISAGGFGRQGRACQGRPAYRSAAGEDNRICDGGCSPDGAKRNPGDCLAEGGPPGFASLHPGYEIADYAASMRRKPFHIAVAAPEVRT